MDEMDEYRERIERRYGDRRVKPERRVEVTRPPPRLFEKELFVYAAVVVVLIALIYFGH